MSRFACIAIVCAIALASCARPIHVDDRDKPESPGIAAAARKAMHSDYPQALAGVANEVSGKTGEFKSYGEVFDYAQARSKEERDKSFKQVSDALDAELKPQEQNYDAAKAAAAFRQVAEGFKP